MLVLNIDMITVLVTQVFQQFYTQTRPCFPYLTEIMSYIFIDVCLKKRIKGGRTRKKWRFLRPIKFGSPSACIVLSVLRTG